MPARGMRRYRWSGSLAWLVGMCGQALAEQARLRRILRVMVQAFPRGVQHGGAASQLDAGMHAGTLGVEVADGDDDAQTQAVAAARVVHEDVVAHV
jgi:hypothetical protein